MNMPSLCVYNDIWAWHLFSGNDYLSVPKGSTNGLRGGLKVILDAEVFDSAYSARGSSGFRIALTDPRDKPIMNQNSIFIAPGKMIVSKETFCNLLEQYSFYSREICHRTKFLDTI